MVSRWTSRPTYLMLFIGCSFPQAWLTASHSSHSLLRKGRPFIMRAPASPPSPRLPVTGRNLPGNRRPPRLTPESSRCRSLRQIPAPAVSPAHGAARCPPRPAIESPAPAAALHPAPLRILPAAQNQSRTENHLRQDYASLFASS